MEIVADRFLVVDDERTVDLSSGDDIVLNTSTAGGPSEQARWVSRCDGLSRLYHLAIARLIDYGVFGEMRRFEAWRCGGLWQGSGDEADRVRLLAASFLRANALTDSLLPASAVRTCGGRAVVLPPTAAGYEADAAGSPAGDIPLEACGLGLIGRHAVDAVAELLAQPGPSRVRTVALWAPRGAGLSTAVEDLARAARLQGYVPLSGGVATSPVLDLLAGRSLFLIDRTGRAGAWRHLIDVTLRSPGPHVLLLAGQEEVRQVPGLPLDRFAPSALVQAVRPRDIPIAVRRRVERSAAQAHGLPGRFAGLLWGGGSAAARDVWGRRAVLKGVGWAAEQSAAYGDLDVRPLQDRTKLTGSASWPAPGELAALRCRMDRAARQLEAGRPAPGERLLRQAIGGLARRHDWAHAARGSIALAGSLLKRGRPQAALALLAEAREYVGKADQDEPSLTVAVLSGVALTDLARLDEAEHVLQAALAAARSSDQAAPLAQVRLALARCLFWRGRYGEAAGLVASIDRSEGTDAHAITITMLSSRIAVGRRDLGGAVSCATQAVEAAERFGGPSLVARAACAAAFAHLAVGDRVGVDHDVARCIRSARAAHDPMVALRARLLAAESARRAGRGSAGAALLERVRRWSGPSVPPTVRARCALLTDLLATGSVEAVVRRHVAATRLEALALFAPETGAGSGTAAVADVVEILRSCQTADEEGTVLAQVCAHLRDRLNASAIAFFVCDAATLVPIASQGSGGRLGFGIAERVMAAGQTVAPHSRQDGVEGGTPIRYGGATIGALVGRWVLGERPDPTYTSLLLTTAATAAGPALAAVMARRVEQARRGVGELLGVSAAMVDVRRAVERAAAAPFAVLIEGESGSGKELVARALHRQSPRRDRPFCTLNCAALPDDLVEAELFGHARGAFTGAVVERAGVFEEAHTGTLLLDEIGELSQRAQAKVLRTIQEGELRRVGENTARRIDVRLVSATNRDLRQEVAAGRFRLDLLYRLDVIRITLPALRERREDIAVMVEHCWREAANRMGSRAVLSTATIAALARYDWPGNVRELQNVLASLAVRSPKRGVVPPTALPPAFGVAAPNPSWRLDQARRMFEERFVRAALVRSGGHRVRAAEDLGLTRQGLTKLMVRLGISEASSTNDEPRTANGEPRTTNDR